MFFKIVGETSRAGAFITCHMKVLATERAIGEMNFGVGAIHPCAAEPAAPQSNGSLALPTLWIAIFAADRKADFGRTLPLAIGQKFVQLRGNKCKDCLWRYSALNV